MQRGDRRVIESHRTGDVLVLTNHRASKRNDVAWTLAQRLQLQGENIEAVVEIFAEATGRHIALQIAIGRSEETELRLLRLGRAERRELALLQHAQQFRLYVRRQLTDFIEEQSAAIGLLKITMEALHGTSESALLVTE